MYNTILLVNITLYFISLVQNSSFSIIKNSCVREELIDLPFFFRHNCNKSMWKNIFLVSLNSKTSPLVHSPPQLKLFPLPNSLLLCPFLYASPSSAALFVQKMISNTHKALSTSSIILADENLPSFSSAPPFIGLHDARGAAFDR